MNYTLEMPPESGLWSAKGPIRICGTTKYYYHPKGIMQIKKESILQGVDFQKTAEWFGVGYGAFREILVSNKIANLILDKRWQGIRLKVVELV